MGEIGATLIAISVPGVKPFVDKFVLRRNIDTNIEDDTKGQSKYSDQSYSRQSDTPMHSLNLRSAYMYDGRRRQERKRTRSIGAGLWEFSNSQQVRRRPKRQQRPWHLGACGLSGERGLCSA